MPTRSIDALSALNIAIDEHIFAFMNKSALSPHEQSENARRTGKRLDDAIRSYGKAAASQTYGQLPADIKDAVEQAVAETDDEDTCVRCGETYSLDDGADPTPLCHPCAQEVARLLAEHLAPMVWPTHGDACTQDERVEAAWRTLCEKISDYNPDDDELVTDDGRIILARRTIEDAAIKYADAVVKSRANCPCRDTVTVNVAIPADLSHTGESRLATKPLDKCVAEVVQALNGAGIATRGSCCGHGGDGEIILECGWTLTIPRPTLPEKHRDACGCGDCALRGLEAASDAQEQMDALRARVKAGTVPDRVAATLVGVMATKCEPDRKARPDEIDHEFLRQSPADVEKLKRQVADLRERERVDRALDGLNTDLLRQEAEDE